MDPSPSVHYRRPVLVVANSSWYLWHYRKLLLQRLQQAREHVIALSPVDSTSPDLSNLLLHIPWRIHRSTDSHPFSFLVSFLRMFLLVRAIKPRLIHSHTLKANLLVAIVSAFFGVPCVMSFAGMGRLSKSNGLTRFVFNNVLLLIIFFALRERCSRWNWKRSPKRSTFVFQNEIDCSLLTQLLPCKDSVLHCVIPGSGVPSRYLESDRRTFANNFTSELIEPSQFEFIYCGRLLRSKGIMAFLEIATHFDYNLFKVFGSVDPSSDDSLLASEVSVLSSIYSNVEFLGNREDPLLHLESKFPILIIPSNYGEGLPRAALEALALCIPVIMSKTSSCGIFPSDIVYISLGSQVEDYIKCFQRLYVDYCDGSLFQKLHRGRELVLSKFTEKSVVEQTFSVYDLIAANPPESYLLDKDHGKLNDWLAQ